MRLKRVVRWFLIVIGVAAVLLCAGAWAFWRYKLRPQLEGPPPPMCSLPAPPPAAGFSPPRQISGPETPGSRVYDIEPHASLRSDGALALAWNARDPIWSGKSGLTTAVLGTDGTLAAAPFPPSPIDRREVFDIWTASSRDSVRVVWLAHDGGRPERNMAVEYAESSDGAAWRPPRRAQAPADYDPGQRGGLDKPMIAITSDGVAHVFYCADKPGGLMATHGPDFARSDPVGIAGAYASLALSAGDTIHLAVEDGDEEASPWGDEKGRILYTASRDHARTWSKPARVSAADEPVPFFFSNPQVGTDDARHLLYVAYPTGGPDGRWRIRLATSPDAGATWSRIDVNDDPPCATHMAPQMAVDPMSGTIHLTWIDSRDGRGFVAYTTCAAGGASCAPSQRLSTPFARFSFARHLPYWLGEYGQLLLDPERRVLHAVWTQPVLESGEPVSRIFAASKKL